MQKTEREAEHDKTTFNFVSWPKKQATKNKPGDTC